MHIHASFFLKRGSQNDPAIWTTFISKALGILGVNLGLVRLDPPPALVLTDVNVFVEGSVDLEIAPDPPPDLYQGHPVHVVGMFHGDCDPACRLLGWRWQQRQIRPL